MFIVADSVLNTTGLHTHLTPESSALRIAESCSVKSGSTLVWMETSWPRASAALSLTARLESCRAFRKVVCSWGRKGFRAMPTWRRNAVQRLEPSDRNCDQLWRGMFFHFVFHQTFANSRVRVSNRAVFTVQAKRSPKIRIRGPVMLTTDGRRASGDVSLMTPPNALAASSFCSGVPVRTPSLRTGRIQVTPYVSIEGEIKNINWTELKETNISQLMFNWWHIEIAFLFPEQSRIHR